MPPDASLLLRPATELAALVRAGEVTAEELTTLAIERIDALDGRVDAFVDRWAEDALAQARGIGPGDPRPFAGVPTAMKNNRAVRGRRLTHGSGVVDLIAPEDHGVTRRIKDAGFVLVGATNLPEFSVTPVTRGRRFGAVRNPWDLGRAAGGSSGGAAAAVAAGMLPIAHGNDGGGSIRIPAAACGLVGLKPSRGRVTLAPDLGWHLLATDGMLARTVLDAAAALDALAGPVPGDLSPLPAVAPGTFADAARRGAAGGPGPMRIALTLDPVFDHEASPADAAATRATARRLEALGHHVEEVDAPWRIPGFLDLFTVGFGAGVGAGVRLAGRARGRDVEAHEVETLTWALYTQAIERSAVDHVLADAQLQGVARRVLEWAATYDAVLTPTLATAPPPVDALDPDGPDPMGGFRDGAVFSPFAAICNVTGQPAVTLPLGVRPPGDEAAGMPVGSHLIGRPAGEEGLLALAAQLEADAGPAPVAPFALAG